MNTETQSKYALRKKARSQDARGLGLDPRTPRVMIDAVVAAENAEKRLLVRGTVTPEEAIANALVMVLFEGGYVIFTSKGRLDVDSDEIPQVNCWVVNVAEVPDEDSYAINLALRFFAKSSRDELEVNWLCAALVKVGGLASHSALEKKNPQDKGTRLEIGGSDE